MKFNSIRKNIIPPNFVLTWWECDITGQVAIPDEQGNADLDNAAPTDGFLNGETDSGFPGGSRQVARLQNGGTRDRASIADEGAAVPDWSAGVTLMGWMKYGNTNTQFGRFINFYDNNASGGATGFTTILGTGARRVQFTVDSGGSNLNNFQSSGPFLFAATWYFVAITIEDIVNGSDVSIFLNGTNKSTASLAGDINLTGTEAWSLGGRYDSTPADDTSHNDARMARCCVISKVLSDADILSCYNSGTPLDQAGIEAIVNA